jgi:bla regulator protein blaR1
VTNVARFGLSLTLSIISTALAQEPPEPRYGYEVASIKKADPTTRGVRIGPGAQGGLRTMNTNLMTLLTFSYDVREYQIMDAPGWANGEGFDVSFTPDKPESFPKPGEATAKIMETLMDRQRQRMQAVLRDRFGLKLRMETRELPIYNLVPAKSGSKLKVPEEAGKGPSMMTNPERGELTGTGANMRMLTNVLSNILKRPVVDNTGVEGTFDIKLHWRPDSLAGAVPSASGEVSPSAEADGASIFTAITEQLGLRLESKKGPVTVYVVEKVERPTEN